MTLVQRFPNAPQNYDAQNEAQFRNMVRQALSDASSPVVLTESVGQSFEDVTGGGASVGQALVYDGSAFTSTFTFTHAMTFSAALTATAGGSLTGTWSDMGSVTTIDINGGTIDGVPIGGTVPAAGAFTTLNATGGGSLTGTWSDLGTVTTVDINGGSIDGTPIGAAVPSTGAFSSVDIDGGTIDGVTLAATALKLGNQTITGNTTLDAADCVVLVDATSNAVTVTLPTAAAGDEVIYHIKRVDNSGYVVKVDANGSETIDGVLEIILLTMDSVTLTSDGTEWWIL
jgi:hypothetical protein